VQNYLNSHIVWTYKIVIDHASHLLLHKNLAL
jgi:hypothetical protein